MNLKNKGDNKNNIVVYTSHCPACKVLINMLDKKDIKYDIVDNNEDIMLAAKHARLMSLPFCELREEAQYKSYREMVNYINSLEIT